MFFLPNYNLRRMKLFQSMTLPLHFMFFIQSSAVQMQPSSQCVHAFICNVL